MEATGEPIATATDPVLALVEPPSAQSPPPPDPPAPPPPEAKKGGFEFIPMYDRVWITPIESSDRSPSGKIILPEMARQKSQRGRVVAVGPGVYNGGTFVQTQTREGDVVVYGKYAGTEVELEVDMEVVDEQTGERRMERMINKYIVLHEGELFCAMRARTAEPTSTTTPAGENV